MPSSPSSSKSTRSDPELLPRADRERTFKAILGSLAQLLVPKPRWNIWQWAEHRRFVAKGVSAKTLDGPKLYDSRDAPHQRKPQESATDPEVQVSVLIMASQIGGKTEIFNNVLSYHMDHEPRSAVVMYPTLDSAEKYSKKKFTPMVEASPALSSILKPARARDSGNTILVKDFPAGSIYFVGANSTPSLRGASGAVLLGDEVDSYKDCAGIEGDSIELLWKRGESFPNCVKMLASTPTVKGLSIIWDWFEDSDQQYWFVPCPKCGKFQQLKWAQIKWPEGDPAKASLVCSLCDAGLGDSDRLEMYFNGEWRPTAPFKGIRGFHLNGIYAPWPAQKGFSNRLHQMAVECIRAKKGGEMKERVWINTFLCELWEEATEEIDHTAIYNRAESYTPDSLPEEVILVLVGVDVQKRWIELEAIGLGLDDETWGVEHAKIEGDTEQGEVWQDLAARLQKTYKRKDGLVLPVTATAIDMRHKPEKVRHFAQRSGIARVFPVYGTSGVNHTTLVTRRFHKQYRLATFAVAGRIAKDILFARMKIEEPGPRYMHFPKGQGYDSKYFEGLTAEVLKRSKIRGVVMDRYEKIRERNEPIDIRQYFLACVDILNPALSHIARNLKPPGEPPPAAGGAKGPEKPPPKDSGGDLSAPGQKPPFKLQPSGQQPRKKIRISGF